MSWKVLLLDIGINTIIVAGAAQILTHYTVQDWLTAVSVVGIGVASKMSSEVLQYLYDLRSKWSKEGDPPAPIIGAR